MIDCQQAKELISVEVDGELNDEEQKMLNEHLVSCNSCQQYKEEMFSLHHELLNLKDLSLEESIVDKLFEQKVIKIEDKKQQSLFRRFKPLHGIVAAALIVGFIIPVAPYVLREKDEVRQELSQADLAGNRKMAEMNKQENKVDADGHNTLMAAEDTTLNTANVESLPPSTKEKTEDASGQNTQKQIVSFDSNQGDPNKGDVTLNSTEDNTTSYGVTFSKITLYDVKEENNQLIVSKGGTIIYQSNEWEAALRAEWQFTSENQITYSLYDKDNKLVGKYIIDLIKGEEKVLD